jgi:hypothetical protein
LEPETQKTKKPKTNEDKMKKKQFFYYPHVKVDIERLKSVVQAELTLGLTIGEEDTLEGVGKKVYTGSSEIRTLLEISISTPTEKLEKQGIVVDLLLRYIRQYGRNKDEKFFFYTAEDLAYIETHKEKKS